MLEINRLWLYKLPILNTSVFSSLSQTQFSSLFNSSSRARFSSWLGHKLVLIKSFGFAIPSDLHSYRAGRENIPARLFSELRKVISDKLIRFKPFINHEGR